MDTPGLWDRHLAGLSDLANGGEERPRVLLRSVLILTPIATVVLALGFDWRGDRLAPHLLAASAMMSGVLIGAFALLATWRLRLDERAESRPESEAPARRQVSAAAAHCLMAVVVSILLAFICVLLVAEVPGGRLWSALMLGAAVYLFGLVLLVVKAAFVSFEASVDDSVRRADRRLSNRIH